MLYKTTTLTFTGLAVALGLRAGLFNIGAESQLAAGGFVAAMVGLVLPAGLPALVTLPVYIVAAAIGGGVVGGMPGVLKAKFGAHEVITTIMLNFIVLALLNYLVAAHLKVDGTLHTADIRAGALPRLSRFHRRRFMDRRRTSCSSSRSPSRWRVAGFLFRTRRGFELRAVGLQPEAAEYGGVNVGARVVAGDGAVGRDRRHRRTELRARLQALLRGSVCVRRGLPRHRGRDRRTEPSDRRRARGAAVRDDVAGRTRGERASCRSRSSTCSRRS